MSLRLRLLLLLLASYVAGGYLLAAWAERQVRPRYLESIEEMLVDTSVLLAGILETQATDPQLGADALRRAFAVTAQNAFEARVFSLLKTSMDLRVYLTDAKGLVLFDSTGAAVGSDFSKWNDVKQTLAGRYGARTTRDIANDDNTQVIFVAAPIRAGDRIVGVVSVGKPTRGINQLVATAKQRLRIGIAVGGVAILLALLAVASWVIAPIERLTDYARAIRDGRPAVLPALPGKTLSELGRAFEQMRDAVDGRQQVERYTQALAHEVKAPLAAIRGAAELLDETMPIEQRKKFLGNIRTEVGRVQQIMERLLELSSLEARKALRQTEQIEAATLAEEALLAVRTACEAAGVAISVEGGQQLFVTGERVLLREAIVNLLQNAAEFTPRNGEVKLRVEANAARVGFIVEDSGPGVPDYALERAFERFYSLPRPLSGRKSTGLGLSLVREIAHLHGGEAMLSNRVEGGARAEFWVPGGSLS